MYKRQVKALEISADTISNSYLRQQIKSTSNKVAEGESLASSLDKIKAIPPLVSQMIENGERSGRLEEMLEKVSVYLENKFQSSTKITMNLLEPLIVVFLGLFVALIVLAILLPDRNSCRLDDYWTLDSRCGYQCLAQSR